MVIIDNISLIFFLHCFYSTYLSNHTEKISKNQWLHNI